MENKTSPTYSDLMNMELHQIVDVHEAPYFRVMKVSTGWLYNFYDSKLDDYTGEWVYVPMTNN